MIWLASQLWAAALLSLIAGFALTWFTVVRPREVARGRRLDAERRDADDTREGGRSRDERGRERVARDRHVGAPVVTANRLTRDDDQDDDGSADEPDAPGRGRGVRLGDDAGRDAGRASARRSLDRDDESEAGSSNRRSVGQSAMAARIEEDVDDRPARGGEGHRVEEFDDDRCDDVATGNIGRRDAFDGSGPAGRRAGQLPAKPVVSSAAPKRERSGRKTPRWEDDDTIVGLPVRDADSGARHGAALRAGEASAPPTPEPMHEDRSEGEPERRRSPHTSGTGVGQAFAPRIEE